jgi:ubiquitin C-terminal hydrolase
MEKTIDLNKTTKKELFGLLRTLSRTNDNYILKENGNFLAAVIAREEYEKYLQKRQAEAQADLEKFLDKIHFRIDQNISDEDLEKLINDAKHAMRGVK